MLQLSPSENRSLRISEVVKNSCQSGLKLVAQTGDVPPTIQRLHTFETMFDQSEFISNALIGFGNFLHDVKALCSTILNKRDDTSQISDWGLQLQKKGGYLLGTKMGLENNLHKFIYLLMAHSDKTSILSGLPKEVIMHEIGTKFLSIQPSTAFAIHRMISPAAPSATGL